VTGTPHIRREGCANSSLGLRAASSRRTPPRYCEASVAVRRASRVLAKAADVAVCRSIQLLALLAAAIPPRTCRASCCATGSRVLPRHVPLPRLAPADRALLVAVRRVLPRARWSCSLVTPSTPPRSHGRLVAGAWFYPHRQTGRPPLDHEVQPLLGRRTLLGGLLHEIPPTSCMKAFAHPSGTRGCRSETSRR